MPQSAHLSNGAAALAVKAPGRCPARGRSSPPPLCARRIPRPCGKHPEVGWHIHVKSVVGKCSSQEAAGPQKSCPWSECAVVACNSSWPGSILTLTSSSSCRNPPQAELMSADYSLPVSRAPPCNFLPLCLCRSLSGPDCADSIPVLAQMPSRHAGPPPLKHRNKSAGASATPVCVSLDTSSLPACIITVRSISHVV